ncbi:hypothetical protein ACWD0A_33820 [Streptomyces sp. NPDC002867]
MTELDLGIVGPAQSDDLYHFTGRNGARPAVVPEEIQLMTPQERLDSILREEQFRVFAPFGARTACLCLSESPPNHLEHLIGIGRFSPWGIVTRRHHLIRRGGGAVAYVPDAVYQQFKAADLEHWAVRTGVDSTWMHEREWRLPLPDGRKTLGIGRVTAILVGDPEWRPSLTETGAWVDRSTGEPLAGPGGNPYAEPLIDLPRLWRESPVWVWDPASRSLVKHTPGELC